MTHLARMLMACFLISWGHASPVKAAPASFAEQDQAFFIHLARQTLSWYLTDGSLPEINAQHLSQTAKQPGACFVTLDSFRI